MKKRRAPLFTLLAAAPLALGCSGTDDAGANANPDAGPCACIGAGGMANLGSGGGLSGGGATSVGGGGASAGGTSTLGNGGTTPGGSGGLAGNTGGTASNGGTQGTGGITGTGGVSSTGGATGSGGAPATSARVRMLHRVTGDDDPFISQANGGDATAKTWLGTHWQSFEGFTGGPTRPATKWLSGGLLYFDTTAVNTGANPPLEHILKRPSNGERCYNPWGGNPNPQVSWNVTSATTRAYLIDQMKQALGTDAWSGLWLDDVNLDPGSSCVGPNDEDWTKEFGSGWANTWADAVATFMEEIRAAFPTRTLLENAPWFSRGPDRWKDPYVARQLKTANLANREGGVLDDGLTTGSDYWSVKSVFDYVDAVHAAGAGIVWDSFPFGLAQRKYALAAYFVGYTDKDFYGDASARNAAAWPTLYDVDLGQPTGPRTFDGNATFSRSFEKGTVTMNVSTKTGSIPGY